MFLAFVLLLIMAYVFFKLGVYSVLLTIFQVLFQALLVVSGAFVVYFVWRKVMARRRGHIDVK
jgi:threonine/homoserine/homoserine lactone efflux protein